MKSQHPLNTLAPITLALSCLVVQNIAQAENKEHKPNTSKVTVATPVTRPAAASATSTDINAERAAAAARRDGDPAVNGSVRDFPPTDAGK